MVPPVGVGKCGQNKPPGVGVSFEEVYAGAPRLIGIHKSGYSILDSALAADDASGRSIKSLRGRLRRAAPSAAKPKEVNYFRINLRSGQTNGHAASLLWTDCDPSAAML